MKQQASKTSSILINIDDSSFHRLNDDFVIHQFSLPSYIKEKFNQYAFLHNWAKDNLDQPYYLNVPSKKLYVLAPKNEPALELTFEDKKLSCDVYADYKSRDKLHIIIKLLLAQYFTLSENFVSNDKFYLHASVNRSKTWATVLKVDISDNYKNTRVIEFLIKDEASRLSKITFEEYQKFHSRDIIYGQSIKNGQLYFKQLKRKEIKDFQGLLFVKPKGFGNTKTQINYHSIMDAAGHETSKAYLLERFSTKFLQFIGGFGIEAFPKILTLTKIESNRTGLEIQNFAVTLIDGRKVKKKPLSEIFQNSDAIIFLEKNLADLNESDNCLFVMDYNREDFIERFKGETDPYKAFKESSAHIGIAKQGICINENYFDEDANDSGNSGQDYLTYEGLGKEDLERNLGICVTQLFLKKILLTKTAALLPHNELLNNHCFCYRDYLLYAEGDKLEIEKFDSSEELLNKIASRFDSLDMANLMQTVYNYHNPFGNKEFDFLNHKLIFSNESVIEIVDIPERAFYDEVEIKQRIADRNKPRVKSEFKSKNNDAISERFNQFIDEEVESIMLSYEELKVKYGKGETGFLKQIFGSKDERPFVKFLNANTDMQVKGLKQDNIFSTYTGVWFDSERNQYFVGRTHGYQHKQDKGSQMKKLITHFGVFNMESFFNLLSVDFIRYKELTVNPFPFKLIEMYDTIISDTLVERS